MARHSRGIDGGHLDRLAAPCARLTSSQIRDAARIWLDKKRSVTGYLIKDSTPKREEKRS